MNERNHWMTFTNDDVVRWGAYLPALRGDAEKLVRFGVRAVDAGRRHAVWDVRRWGGARPYVYLADRDAGVAELRRRPRGLDRLPISRAGS
jgi:hypothetical protein